MSTRLELRVVPKTAAYTVSPAKGDRSDTLFTNDGATGSVTFTLPSAAVQLKGWSYRFMAVAAQAIVIAAGTAGDLVSIGTGARDSVTLASSFRILGGMIEVFCTGTKWLVRNTGEGSRKSQTLSADTNVALVDSGYDIYIDTDAKVITLPATAIGINYRFINAGADGAVLVALSPNAADKISGAGLTPADNKDLLNTKATAKFGDSVRLMADGVDGWVVMEMTGIWAREA